MPQGRKKQKTILLFSLNHSILRLEEGSISKHELLAVAVETTTGSATTWYLDYLVFPPQ